MKEKEFKTLSEKWHFGDELLESGDRYYKEKDIREFIKIIEEIVLNPKTTLIRKVAQIRAKAGPNLI